MIEAIDQLDSASIDRALVGKRGGLHDFIRVAWDQVEPAREFVDNWHIGAMAEHLEAVADGEITRLVINVPPGTMKSLTCSVFFPAWLWGPRDLPGKKFIYGSYLDTVSFRDSRRTIRLINSDWYQARWGDRFTLLNKSVERTENDEGGFRMATTVRGAAVGEHADIQFVDDPLKPYEVSKSLYIEPAALREVIDWWRETMSSRVTDVMKTARIIIMQRLHDNDLAGHVLSEGGYVHLMLPMKFEKDRKCITKIGFEDPRKEEGELLFPARFPLEGVDQQAKELGPRATQAQHQQNPILNEGNIILGEWMQHWSPSTLPLEWLAVIQSWDCTFTGSDNSDFVVGQVWGAALLDYLGRLGVVGYFLLDEWRKQAGLKETCMAMQKLTTKYPKSYNKLVENKANGPAVVETLDGILNGLKLVEPQGGKLARVHGTEPTWADMRVFLPPVDHVNIQGDKKWIVSYMAEQTGFPAKTYDDRVDSTSQALLYFEQQSIMKLSRAMANAKRG